MRIPFGWRERPRPGLSPWTARRGSRRDIRHGAGRSILRIVLIVAAISVLYALRRAEEEDPYGNSGRRRAPAGDGPAALPISCGRVSAIADGDSIVLEGGGEVRYLGVDAPERGEPFSEEAREANRALVLGREVSLEPGGPEPLDAYGRILAIVLVSGEDGEDPLCVNVELVRRGLASVYLKGTEAPQRAFLDAILGAQREAIAEGRGLWPGRLAAAEEAEEPLVATRFRIHRDRCEALGTARVASVEDIRKEFQKGKSLCRRCRPLGGP